MIGAWIAIIIGVATALVMALWPVFAADPNARDG